MAAIDKIYGNMEQQIELRRWIKRHLPKAYAYTYDPEYFSHLAEDAERPIANFGRSHDAWLARKCHLKFVLERLTAQYGGGKTGRIAASRLNSTSLKEG